MPLKNRIPVAVLVIVMSGTMLNCQGQTGSPKLQQGEKESPAPVMSPSAGGAPFTQFQHVFADVADKVMPAVVSVKSERKVEVTRQGMPFDFFNEDPFGFFFGQPRQPRENQNRPPQERQESGLGSGVIVTEDGYILTNNHVIQGADKLIVQLSDESEYEAKVIGSDPASDLAVIKITDEKKKFAKVPFGDSDKIRIGEWVVAVGSPFGLYKTVTTGIVSAKGRKNTGISTYGNFIQTDAAINPGNSGGPLVNLHGELVGINTAIYSRTGGYQGIGFAIPVALAQTVMQDLIKDGEVTRGWLGVSIQPVTEDMASALGLKSRKGALIGDVLPDGPAAKAGMKRGDVITKIANNEIDDVNDLLNRVAALRPGTTVEVTVHRDGKSRGLKTKIEKREAEKSATSRGADPEPTGLSSLGMEATELTEASARRYGVETELKAGLLVTQVTPGGPAVEAGLRSGDIVVEANRKPVKSAAELKKALEGVKKGEKALILINRSGNTFYGVLTMP